MSSSSSQGSCTFAAGTVTCALGNLASGADATVTVRADTPGDGSGNGAVNTATVSTTSTDPNPGDNTASYTLSSAPQANLTMTKTVSPDPVVAGQTVTWTLVTRNTGPSTANNVTVTDQVPSGITGISASPAGSCTVAGNLVTCTRATLARDTDFAVTITGTVPASRDPGPLANTATANAATPPDPTQADNTDTATGGVITRADLSLTKSGPATITAGGTATYNLTVTNAGPSDARDVTITDQFPPVRPSCPIPARRASCRPARRPP